jgi:hypothetical protein
LRTIKEASKKQPAFKGYLDYIYKYAKLQEKNFGPIGRQTRFIYLSNCISGAAPDIANRNRRYVNKIKS